MSLCCGETRTLLTITDCYTNNCSSLVFENGWEKESFLHNMRKRITSNPACFLSLKYINTKGSSIAVDLVTATYGNSSIAEC